MSEQQKDQTLRKRASQASEKAPEGRKSEAAPPNAEGVSATAALALAVTSAQKDVPALKTPSERRSASGSAPSDARAAASEAGSVKPAVIKPAAPKPATVAPAAAANSDGAPPWRRGALAATLAVAACVGWVVGTRGGSHEDTSQSVLKQWSEASAGLRQSQEDVVRLTGDVRSLKIALDGIKEGIERIKGETVGRQSQLLERLDRLDRAAQDTAGKAGRIAEQIERLPGVERAPARTVPLALAPERPETGATTTSAGLGKATVAAAAPAAPEPGQTGSIDNKPPAKPPALEGWVLRDIYDGVALVEGPNRRLVEVSPGQTVASLGRIEAIERRGRTWVVVTSKGVIGTERSQ